MRDAEVNETYYQPYHLWTGSQAIRELYEIMYVPKKDVKSWLCLTSAFTSSCSFS